MDRIRQPDEYEYVIRQQMAEIDRLRAEVKCLTADADAHATLRSIYTNPASSESIRVKAASAALPVEKPRLLSVVPASGPSRIERWRAYARFQLQKEIIMRTKERPPPGWDARLVGDTYEPPAEGEPPLDLYGKDAISAFCDISSLLPRPGQRDDGNGGDEPSSVENKRTGGYP